MDWFRSWHGAPTDNKWISIGKRSGVEPGIVSAIVWALFDHASQNTERGSIEGFDVETYSAFSGFEEVKIGAVIKALEDKGLIDNSRLAAWDRRQYSENNSEVRKLRSSYVYFIGTTLDKPIKIGISKNPWSRVKDLQTGSDIEYSVLAAIKTNQGSEVDFHKVFKNSRRKGEWFSPCKALISLLEKVSAKEIEDHESAILYLSSLKDEGDFSPTHSSYGSNDATTKIQIQIQSREEKKEVSPNGDTARLPKEKFVLPDWIPEEAWNGYVESRKRMTPRARTLTVASLDKLRVEGHDPAEVLNQSVMRGWTGVFAVKTDFAKQGQAPPKQTHSDKMRHAAARAVENMGGME